MATDDTDLDDALAELDVALPASSWLASRRRLFATLAWAGAGFVGVAVLASVLVPFSQSLFQGVGLSWASVSVAIGFAVFGGVMMLAVGLTEDDRSTAQFLLWGTAAVYAVLVHVFVAGLDVTDGEAAHQLLFFVAGAVLASGGAVLLILALAVAIGFESNGSMFARWLAFVALTAGGVMLLDTDLWWVGLICGIMLAWAVDLTVSVALQHPDVPEPALAACLVAGVSAVVLLVILVVVRFVLRWVAEFLAASSR